MYLPRVNCQRVVLVGDAHLGRGSPEAETAFLAFLDAVPVLGDGLVITGDLFEFWFAYSRVVPRRGARVVAALAHLRRTVPVLMVGGNHDRWGGSFWQEELGIQFAPLEARFEVGGRQALVIHGDGISETHWSAGVLHRLLRHPLTVALYRALHPDAGLWLVDRLSGYLGDRDRTPLEINASATRQHGWARSRLDTEPSLGLLVMGHTHRTAVVATPSGQLYVNPGAWLDGLRYAVVSEGTATLAHFSP
jgi:UDP-2,3-diacylglucosamine hydrolase